MNTELLLKAQQLESKIKELQEHLNFVDSQILELDSFSENIKALSSFKNNEIISSIGKGVHVPAQITSKSLFVEVGAGIVLKKTHDETIKIIESQLSRIKQARINILSELDSNHIEFRYIIEKIQS